MIETKQAFTKERALELYEDLLLPRLVEERMITLLRQGKISKWFSGIGQEAIAVGTAHALSNSDYLLPMHRNLGLFTTRGVPLYRLVCQWLGKPDGYTQGRDRSFHFGSMDHRIIGMISHLGANLPVADGIALACKMRSKSAIALAFCGDGATSEGDFHEALNLAAVWELPVIFLVENNGYGLSTPTSQQYACSHLMDKSVGYGMEGVRIDGNHIFEVMETVARAKETALSGKPVLIEAETFRMRGHEEASGTFYVPEDEMDCWAERDPIQRYEEWLNEKNYLEHEQTQSIKENIEDQIRQIIDKAMNAADPVFDYSREISAVFAETGVQDGTQPKGDKKPKSEQKTEKRYVDALRDALDQALSEDETCLIMGQDIAEYGGVFKITDGFLEQFGSQRIRNTPIIESGALGAAVGLALCGMKPVVEMQFADFISCGFNQMINNLAKGHYRWMPPLNVTIRCPHGAGVGAGPFHSESPEGWFMQHPGLKIMVPASVEDAQNMLYSAILEPNPVLLFEHKKLYRSLKSAVPNEAKPIDTGVAKVIRSGSHATIITYGLGVQWAMEAASEYEKKGIFIEIVDLRSLIPIDKATIASTVKKTNRVLLLQEPSEILGPMSEVAAYLTEHCFEYLDAPLIRCSSLNTPVPFHKNLERGYLARSRLNKKLNRLLSY